MDAWDEAMKEDDYETTVLQTMEDDFQFRQEIEKENEALVFNLINFVEEEFVAQIREEEAKVPEYVQCMYCEEYQTVEFLAIHELYECTTSCYICLREVLHSEYENHRIECS